MAASHSQAKYDVFLSFRGEDTRFTFTSHLYAALCRKNIHTFIDDEQLKKGDELSSTILTAIEGSKISLVIFSENYATSTWCLDELVKIIECKKIKRQILLPVFYHIDPSHVRKQSGTYERAFAKHEVHNQAKVHKWRMAMQGAANSGGWDSSNIRLESKLVESIVEDVLQKLNNIHKPQEAPNGIVGIQKQIACIESLLCNGSTNMHILGIWGMGGIGKTTIADALFKKISPQYEGSCFVENVREELKNHGKLHLRNKLLTQILGDEKLYINTPNRHSTFVVERLQRRKMLVILDDVNDSQQIEDLVGEKNWFGPNSRIIVTTRNKDVLRNQNGVLFYEVMQLNIEEALHLFSLKAFQQDHPKEEFRHVSKMVVNYAKGLPLALKVLGSALYSKSLGEWESTLKKLKKVPNAEIHHVLSLSYEGLDYDEQNIFLDIACCLKGETTRHITSLLDGCNFFPEIGLRSLENKSLITISEYDIVNMHDMIQEMGWQIVRQESKREIERRSRLWDSEEIHHVFKRKMGTDHSAESISLDMSQIKEVEINPQTFVRMHNLRLLKFYLPCDQKMYKRCNVRIPKNLEFPLDELRYLRWDSFPLRALPTSFHAEMLVELDLKDSLVEKLWDGDQQNLKNLKSLCLCDCQHLIELPNLSNAKKLEEIQLVRCTSLRDLPPSIFSLDHLFALDLEGCKELPYIRCDTHSGSLRWLNLNYCSRLTEFSVTLEKLEYLSLNGTAIGELPSTVGRSSDLFYLSLSSCKKLKNLPNNFYHMGSNDTSKQLEILPLMFQTSLPIKRLCLEGCSNLSELPNNFGLYSALNELSLQESSIETLPASIKLLSQLRTLNVSFCKRLGSLPELPLLLQELNARECISLETVSGFTATALIQNYFGSQNRRLLLRQFHESKVSVDHESYWEKFDFTNCIRLGKNGRKTILNEAAIRIKFAACVSSTLQSNLDPSHQFHLLFKDTHLDLEFIRRRLILNSGFPTMNSLPTWNSLRKIESSTLTIEFNANCCSSCKDSQFAFGLCWSKRGENTGPDFDRKHRVCMQNLDGSSMLFYDKLWFNDVNVRLPGSKVPRWFRYRATNNRITIELASSSQLLGFAFCLVFSPFIPTDTADFICEFRLRGSRMFRSYIFDLLNPTSDTVSLCYDATTSNRILEAVKESIATDNSASCNIELSFEFYGLLDQIGKSEKGIKGCGVWPIYVADLEPKKNKKLEKKRKRSLAFWNWKCRWRALITRTKKSSTNRFFKYRNGTKSRILKNSNEQQQQQLPARKKYKRSQDI